VAQRIVPPPESVGCVGRGVGGGGALHPLPPCLTARRRSAGFASKGKGQRIQGFEKAAVDSEASIQS